MSVAFDVWANLLQGKQVVCFIDNNAVRDSLISCKLSSKVGSCLLEHVLQEEAQASIFSWFALQNAMSLMTRPGVTLLSSQDFVNEKRKSEWLDRATPFISPKRSASEAERSLRNISKRRLRSGLCGQKKNCACNSSEAQTT